MALQWSRRPDRRVGQSWKSTHAFYYVSTITNRSVNLKTALQFRITLDLVSSFTPYYCKDDANYFYRQGHQHAACCCHNTLCFFTNILPVLNGVVVINILLIIVFGKKLPYQIVKISSFCLLFINFNHIFAVKNNIGKAELEKELAIRILDNSLFERDIK